MLQVPTQQVVDQPPVVAVGRDGAPSQLDDAPGIGLEVGGGVHGGEEHAAVDAVAVVHDAALAPAQVLGGLRQPRRDHADVVALDLEVDVVGVRVVGRVSGQLGGHSLQEILARLAVRVPHQERRLPIGRGEILGGRVETLGGDHREHPHVHVEVVFVDQPVTQGLLLHVDGALEDPAVERELQRLAHRGAVRLADPCAEDPVLQHELGDAGQRFRFWHYPLMNIFAAYTSKSPFQDIDGPYSSGALASLFLTT